MIHTRFIDLFNDLAVPQTSLSNNPFYAVIPIPGYANYFLGKDKDSLACLLIKTENEVGRPPPPIRLESLDAQFELRCHLKKAEEPELEGVFTVVRCRDRDENTIRYFLSICETIVNMIGDRPNRSKVSEAVNRLADIFQKIQKPATRSLNGLFGELYVLYRSSSALKALDAWRIDDRARFDFSTGKVRLEAKAVTGRSRVHSFSYEQCNPPAETIAAVASMHVEQIGGGMSVSDLMGRIEARVPAKPDLILKLHETVAETLGAGLNEGLSQCFDMSLAKSSFKLFDLRAVPAIRDPLPAAVSDVHFRSDLSSVAPVSASELIAMAPDFKGLLPSEGRRNSAVTRPQ